MSEPFTTGRRQFIGISAATALESYAASKPQPNFPSLNGATTWLNSRPLSPASLKGKVVLIDFWTYTCVNWIRTLPYVRAWASKYKDQGLVVIGVHSPEFGFEKNLENITRAIETDRIEYPVAVDSDHAIWRAFTNQAWPALYFIDVEGRIRHRHLGEGDYENSERWIQQLLAETGAKIDRSLVSVNPTGLEVAADWASLQSPENFLGSVRTQNFDSSSRSSIPQKMKLNHWALSGDWSLGNESVALNKGKGRIAYRFQARDVNLVMGPAKPFTSVPFRVLIEGQPPAESHGSDVDKQGEGIVTSQRVYQLIRQAKPIASRLLEIEFLNPGVEAFSFTFG